MNHKPFMKCIASVVVFIFVATSPGVQPNAFAAAPEASLPSRAQLASPPISSGHGEVQEVYKGGSGKTIYYIQDAHNSVEAQQHIASLIQELVKKSGVRLVFEEGYEGQVPTDEYFSEIQDPAIKAKVSGYFLDQLRLGGAEYAHINRAADNEQQTANSKNKETEKLNAKRSTLNADWRLVGVDSLRLHRETIEWYRKAAVQKAAVASDLETLFNLLQDLVRRKFPGDFQKWIEEKQALEEGRLPFDVYLKGLLKKLQGIEGINLGEEFPTLSGVLKAEKDAVRGEATSEKINARNLLQEMRKAEIRLTEQWLTEPEERELFRLWETVRQARHLNEIEIASEEFGAFGSHFNRSITEEIAGFAARETRRTVILSKRWEKLIANVLKFYETALARESVLKEHLTQFARSENPQAVLVYGGFHRAGIQKILKELDISYVVLSPKITQTSAKHEDLYRQLMQQGVTGADAVPHAVSTASRTLTLFESSDGRSEIRLARTILQNDPLLTFDDLFLKMKHPEMGRSLSKIKGGILAAQNPPTSRLEMPETKSTPKTETKDPARPKINGKMKLYAIVGTIALLGATVPMAFLLQPFIEGESLTAFLYSFIVSALWASGIASYCVWMQDYLYKDPRVFFSKEFWNDAWDFVRPNVKLAVFFTFYYFLIEMVDLSKWFAEESAWFKTVEVAIKMIPDALLNYFVFYPIIFWISFKDVYHQAGEPLLKFIKRPGFKKNLGSFFIFFFPLELVAMGLNEFVGPGFSYLAILCGDIIFQWKLLKVLERLDMSSPEISKTTATTHPHAPPPANTSGNGPRSETRTEEAVPASSIYSAWRSIPLLNEQLRTNGFTAKDFRGTWKKPDSTESFSDDTVQKALKGLVRLGLLTQQDRTYKIVDLKIDDEVRAKIDEAVKLLSRRAAPSLSEIYTAKDEIDAFLGKETSSPARGKKKKVLETVAAAGSPVQLGLDAIKAVEKSELLPAAAPMIRKPYSDYVSPTFLLILTTCVTRAYLEEHDPIKNHEVPLFLKMLFENGVAHEEKVLLKIAKEITFLDLRAENLRTENTDALGERFKRTREAMKRGEKLIYQGVLLDHDRKLKGIPDFLLCTGKTRSGEWRYVPIDAKSGRAMDIAEITRDGEVVDHQKRQKKTYAVQLAEYTDMLIAMGHQDPLPTNLAVEATDTSASEQALGIISKEQFLEADPKNGETTYKNLVQQQVLEEVAPDKVQLLQNRNGIFSRPPELASSAYDGIWERLLDPISGGIIDIHEGDVAYSRSDLYINQAAVDYDMGKSGSARSKLTFWQLYEAALARAREIKKANRDGNPDLNPDDTAKKPALSSLCPLCPFYERCKKWAAANDDPSLLTGIARAGRDALHYAGIRTVHDLAHMVVEKILESKKTKKTSDPAFLYRIGEETLRHWKESALARIHNVVIIHEPLHLLLDKLIRIQYDIETIPFTLRQIVYLHGFWREDFRPGHSKYKDGAYVAFTAKGNAETEEKSILRRTKRWLENFDRKTMAVYHYSPFERWNMEKLATLYPDVMSVEEVQGFFNGTVNAEMFKPLGIDVDQLLLELQGDPKTAEEKRPENSEEGDAAAGKPKKNYIKPILRDGKPTGEYAVQKTFRDLEKSSLLRISFSKEIKEQVFAILTASRFASDLYLDVVSPNTFWPIKGKGLKPVAQFLGFEWEVDEPGGAQSIVMIEKLWELKQKQAKGEPVDPQELERVERWNYDYNRGDNMATAFLVHAFDYMLNRNPKALEAMRHLTKGTVRVDRMERVVLLKAGQTIDDVDWSKYATPASETAAPSTVAAAATEAVTGVAAKAVMQAINPPSDLDDETGDETGDSHLSGDTRRSETRGEADLQISRPINEAYRLGYRQIQAREVPYRQDLGEGDDADKREGSISRGLYDLIKWNYGDYLRDAIAEIRRRGKGKVLFVGPGRGKAILEMLEPMQDLSGIKVYSINKEPGMLYDLPHIVKFLDPSFVPGISKIPGPESKIGRRARQLFNALHRDALIRDISVSGTLDNVPRDFDLVIVGSWVLMYVGRQLDIQEKLDQLLAAKGRLFTQFLPSRITNLPKGKGSVDVLIEEVSRAVGRRHVTVIQERMDPQMGKTVMMSRAPGPWKLPFRLEKVVPASEEKRPGVVDVYTYHPRSETRKMTPDGSPISDRLESQDVGQKNTAVPILTTEEIRKLTPVYPSMEAFFKDPSRRKNDPDTVFLTFLRHGNSTSNLYPYTQGPSTFSPLTFLGMLQRHFLSKFLLRFQVPFDRIVSSPYERALSTVEPAAKAAGKNLEIDAALREADTYAPFEGMPREQIQGTLDALENSFLSDPERYETGEFKMSARLAGLEKFLRAIESSEAKSVLAASHGTTISLAMLKSLGINLKKYRGSKERLGDYPSGALTTLGFHKKTGTWELLVWSDNSFIPKMLRRPIRHPLIKAAELMLMYLRIFLRDIKKQLGRNAPYHSPDYWPGPGFLKGPQHQTPRQGRAEIRAGWLPLLEGGPGALIMTASSGILGSSEWPAHLRDYWRKLLGGKEWAGVQPSEPESIAPVSASNASETPKEPLPKMSVNTAEPQKISKEIAPTAPQRARVRKTVRDPSPALSKTLTTMQTPVMLHIDFKDLIEKFSPAQRKELLIAAYFSDKVRLAIYRSGEIDPKDPRAMPFRQLAVSRHRNVRIYASGTEDAAGKTQTEFTKGWTRWVNLGLEKSEEASGLSTALEQIEAKRLVIFRYLPSEDRSGLVTQALQFAQATLLKEKIPEHILDRLHLLSTPHGFTVASQYLAAIETSIRGDFAIAGAA